MSPAFRGPVPHGDLYDPRHHTWVRRDGATVLVGITAFGVHSAGEIIAFTSKPKGARVEAGRGIGTVESAKTVHAVHAPLGFVLLDINEALEDRPAPINLNPHNAWLARGQALDWERDAARLLDAAAYRAQILSMEPEATFT